MPFVVFVTLMTVEILLQKQQLVLYYDVLFLYYHLRIRASHLHLLHFHMLSANMYNLFNVPRYCQFGAEIGLARSLLETNASVSFFSFFAEV